MAEIPLIDPHADRLIGQPSDFVVLSRRSVGESTDFVVEYSDDEERGADGKWTGGGGFSVADPRARLSIDQATSMLKERGYALDFSKGESTPTSTLYHVTKDGKSQLIPAGTLAKFLKSPHATIEDFTGNRVKEYSDSPSFRAWFGDSKLVGANGKPAVMYFGTTKDINKFNPGKIFFAVDPKAADAYARGMTDPAAAWDKTTKTAAGGNIKPVYVAMNNPYHGQVKGDPSDAKLKKLGYDGRVFPPFQKGKSLKLASGFEYSYGYAFASHQLKSATGNSGKFSRRSGDIREDYNPDEERDDDGKWTDGGSSTGGTISHKEASALFDRVIADGGFTYQPLNDTSPKEGFAVSTFRGEERQYPLDKLTPDDVFDYMKVREAKFADPRVHVGGWVHEGKCFLDLSTVEKDRGVAEALGKKNDQLAIFNLGTFETIPVASGRHEQRESYGGSVRLMLARPRGTSYGELRLFADQFCAGMKEGNRE